MAPILIGPYDFIVILLFILRKYYSLATKQAILFF